MREGKENRPIGSGGTSEGLSNDPQSPPHSNPLPGSASTDIRAALALVAGPNSVHELRVLGTSRGTVSGYFDDLDLMAEAAAEWSGNAEGVYVTLNPVVRSLLARANNRCKTYAKHTTSDSNVLERRWLPLDFDPVRASGISSTDEEHDATLERARECRLWLCSLGWPEPLVADSGNGAHLLYRIELPNDDDSRGLVERCLKAVAFNLGDESVEVDLKTGNAARIWKVFGTLAAKGDSTPDRPHRFAQVLDVPAEMEVVPPELLEALAASVPTPPVAKTKPAGRGEFDLESWIGEKGLPVVRSGAWNGGKRWVLSPCPWNADHTDNAAYIVQLPSGAIGAGCQHNGCDSKKWPDLRALYEPPGLDHSASDFSSNHRERPLEEGFTREVNAAELQAHGRERGTDALPYLPLLGQPGYLVQGWSTIIASYPKVGKTELVTSLLAEWSDHRILYCTEEPESIWEERLARREQDYSHVQVYFALGAEREELLTRMERGPEDIVVFDTVRNLFGLHDETNNSEVARALIPYISSARRYAQTPIFLHHDRKGGGEHGEGIAGAHAFLGVIDLALELRRDPGSASAAGTRLGAGHRNTRSRLRDG